MDGDANVGNSQDSAEKQLFESSKPRDTLVGTTLDGRFYIEEVLGAGGMSVVYKARQLRVDRHVAIKTIRMQVDTKPVYRERFQREINSLCALSHPNIVTVYDCLIGDNDQPYVVMDYLRGKSLEALIKEDGPLPIERFARISVQVCSALTHAHKKNIIHRDLKPGNVVLMDDEMDFVKVVDFGLAKIGEEQRKLTRSGELWGSPPYMSPEQCMGKSGDVRSDIYAWGVVMYEMLTGKDPFHQAAAVFELIQLHINSPPPALTTTNPLVRVPPRVEEVVFKCLEKDPEKRYQNAEQLQEALVAACANADARDSGDLLVHIPLKSRPSGEQSSPSGQTYGEQPAANYFDMALDPLGGADIESLFTEQPSSGAPAASAPASAAQTAPVNPTKKFTSSGAPSIPNPPPAPIDPADLRWRNPQMDAAKMAASAPTPIMEQRQPEQQFDARAGQRTAPSEPVAQRPPGFDISAQHLMQADQAANREPRPSRTDFDSGRLRSRETDIGGGGVNKILIAVIAVVVIGGVAAAAFMLRPQPKTPDEMSVPGEHATAQPPAQAPPAPVTAPAAAPAPAPSDSVTMVKPGASEAPIDTTSGAAEAPKPIKHKVVPPPAIVRHHEAKHPPAAAPVHKHPATAAPAPAKHSAPAGGGDLWNDLQNLRHKQHP